MKKTLISLSVISAFTVVSSPVFAAQTVDPVPGTADSPLAVVIGQGSTNTGATSTGVAIGNESKSVNNSVAIGHKSSSKKDAVSIGEGANAGEL